MASTINASSTGVGGLVSSGDSSGELQIQTGGTTAITVSSSQAVSLANALPVASGGTGLTSVGTNGQFLQSNGSGLQYATLSVSGTLLNIQYFTTPGTATYTPTAGTNFVIVEVVGGGGGGANYSAATSGGSGGGYARKKITSSFSGVTVTVGAGGAIAGNGGSSSFGALVSATGGSAGIIIGTAFPVGGVGSSGDLNLYGGSTCIISSTLGGVGGSSFYGVGGTGSAGAIASTAGRSYGGGGGGGGSTSTSGSAGASGIVIVYEFA